MITNIKPIPTQVSEAVLLRRRIEDCIRKNPNALRLVAELLKKEGYIK